MKTIYAGNGKIYNSFEYLKVKGTVRFMTNRKTGVQAEIYRGFSDAISEDFVLKRRWKPGLIRLFPQRNA